MSNFELVRRTSPEESQRVADATHAVASSFFTENFHPMSLPTDLPFHVSPPAAVAALLSHPGYGMEALQDDLSHQSNRPIRCGVHNFILAPLNSEGIHKEDVITQRHVDESGIAASSVLKILMSFRPTRSYALCLSLHESMRKLTPQTMDRKRQSRLFPIGWVNQSTDYRYDPKVLRLQLADQAKFELGTFMTGRIELTEVDTNLVLER